MNDGADLRVHPSGKAVVSISAQTQGQGHETTFAQIVAEELGIPPEDIEVRHGDTDKSPYGLGTYGSRSTPVSGAAVAIVSRKVRDKARLIAATMLETRPEDLAWEKGRWYVKGDPEKGAMIEDIALRAYSGEAMPEGLEGGLDAQVIYDPPNLTYPYGAYIAVVDIDPGHGAGHRPPLHRGRRLRRAHQPDDRRRPDPRRARRGHRHRADGADQLRRGGQLPQLVVHGLPDPDRARVPRLRARRDGHAVPAPPARRQGRRRVAERGLAAGDRQRGDRRALPDARRRAHRHALHARARVGGDAGPPGAAAVITAALSRRAQELAAAGEAFATATVVHVQRPTSVEPGNVALVLADGTIEGFVGGMCSEHSVRAYALQALETGRPVLLRILPFSEEAEPAGAEGTATVQNPCLSGGAIEVFLEPVLPAPRVLVVGDDADRRSAAAARLGARATTSSGWMAAPSTRGPGEFALVVAAHGRDELHTLRRGLEAGLPYVGLVASRKRGEGVLAELRGDGVPEELLARIDVPAGLDLGARTPAEIALSILAKIVTVRHSGARGPGRRAHRPRRGARAAGGRPDLRHDRRRGCGHAVGRARRRDGLLLLRRLQGGSSRPSTAMPTSGTDPAMKVTGEAADEVEARAPDIETLARALAGVDYLVDEGLATSLFLCVRLPQPLLLEGEAGVGKTEAAKALATVLDTPLVRLQCYEGIDAAEALYEWNYPRQLLSIRLADASGATLREEDLFGPDYLIRRPLLQALEHPGPRPAVLLIDEIDRADDDFEAFLLELLAEASVTIPEIGTITATHPPIIVLTSNRTRDLHDAVKRRCLYHWIDYPRRRSASSRSCAGAWRGRRRRSPSRSRTRSRACATATCRSRPASPRRSTGSPPSACSASSGWTPRRSTARSAPCSSTARIRMSCARRASRSSCAVVTDAGLRRRDDRARPAGAARARSAGGCTRRACPSRPQRSADFRPLARARPPALAAAAVLDDARGDADRSRAGQGVRRGLLLGLRRPRRGRGAVRPRRRADGRRAGRRPAGARPRAGDAGVRDAAARPLVVARERRRR